MRRGKDSVVDVGEEAADGWLVVAGMAETQEDREGAAICTERMGLFGARDFGRGSDVEMLLLDNTSMFSAQPNIPDAEYDRYGKTTASQIGWLMPVSNE